VTPSNLAGFGAPPDGAASSEPAPVVSAALSDPPEKTRRADDDAWRQEVLERVRKRRQARTHSLPLFAEGQVVATVAEDVPSAVAVETTSLEIRPADPPAQEEPLVEELVEPLENADPRPAGSPPDLLAALDIPLGGFQGPAGPPDWPLRPAEMENAGRNPQSRVSELPGQSPVERPRPSLVPGSPLTRSLVADLPLVEASRPKVEPATPPSRGLSPASSRAASMNDRLQAAVIDVGLWSGMTVVAFYFASRIARSSIMALGPAWPGLALFATVLAAAYMLFFGGLSGASPGKIACGIQVKRYDGSPLGPLASLARGFLGVLGVGLFGLGIWPAFWDKDRRALHDRATDSRVTIV
jgi:uncharacterized RDD family membrane protein YckC